jgi:2-oxoglutarate/2-oxoacid ferredoxin oxidoreductase subunit alpha
MAKNSVTERPVQTTDLDAVAIRFCGDSGDGMQLTGGQFTETSAMLGNDFATFADYPAEIRAPKGTMYGVSGFQVQFANNDIFTPGDKVNAMVAMNPAGFRANINDVEPGGIVIVNEDEFTEGNLKKCGYEEGYHPLEDEDLTARFRIFRVAMSRMTRESLAESDMGAKDVDRCRNMFALGIVYWLFDRPLDTTINYLKETFDKQKGKPKIAEINIRALKAGFYFGETAEVFPVRYHIAPARLEPGTYRRVSGADAIVMGMVTGAVKANKEMLYASYPITPASDVLHGLARLKHFGVKTMQCEDEIAAICAAIGGAYAGNIAATGTSGPGLALKSEALGLAVILELPLLVINVQRAGPSTGMPTKTEQADLLQAFYGRPGECPCIIVAPQSPADCFDMAVEATRLAVQYMCPVIYLADGYIVNGAEPWRLPDVDAIKPIVVNHPAAGTEDFLPYSRDPETLARPWAIPGVAGLEHRIGSLEKEEGTGNVSYDPENHEKMVKTRAAKVQRAADIIPPLTVRGPESGEILLLGWGGTYGSITTAGDRLRQMGHDVATAHLRYLNPFPSNLHEVLNNYRTIAVPEINAGQLVQLLRSQFLIDAIGINEIQGRAFRVNDLVSRVEALIKQ